MSPDGGVGDRIRVYRRRRGLSQRQLAGLVGRSESWLSQVERGILPVENLGILIRLAEVLRVQVRVLTGVPFYLAPNGGVQLGEVEGIRAALSGCAEIESWLRSAPLGAEVPSLSELRQRVDQAWQLRQSSQYAQVARKLPDLIFASEAATRHYVGDDRLEAYALMAETYQVTRAVLRKIGETQLAWIAGDRAVHAARAAERPLELAVGARALGLVFLADGRLVEADRVVTAGLRGLEAQGPRRSRPSWSVWGALSLMGALVAARKGDRATAADYLNEAGRAAEEVGTDANDLRTGFGPTNVAIHRVSVAVELGDPLEALNRASEVDLSNLPDQFRERRSSLLIDVARAYSQRRDKGTAVLHLLEAERLAPQEVRYNFIVREMLRDFLRREGKLRTPGLWPLAQRVGVLN